MCSTFFLFSKKNKRKCPELCKLYIVQGSVSNCKNLNTFLFLNLCVKKQYMTTSHWTPSYDYSPMAMSPEEVLTKSIIYLLLSHIPIIRISESGCEFFCFLNSRDVMIDKTKFVSKKKICFKNALCKCFGLIRSLTSQRMSKQFRSQCLSIVQIDTIFLI